MDYSDRRAAERIARALLASDLPKPLFRKLHHRRTLMLEERLRAVRTHGAGGYPTCHDAELRGAIAKLRELVGGLPMRGRVP